MATLETISMYAMYVIGEVESHWNWNSVNPNDAITIGMMQWYGQRAANLIERCSEADPEGYAVFKAAAPRVAAAVETGHDWDWWTGFHLTGAETAAWQTWAERDQVHAVQQLQWLDDFEDYWDALTGKGMPETNVKQIIYAMSMRHQNPQYSNEVLGSAGFAATLPHLHATCLNHPVFGSNPAYVNRYNQVFLRLYEWDGESDPPDFGQLTDIIIGGNPTEGIVTRPTAPVSRVEMRNGNIVLWGMESYPQGLYCIPAGPLTWVPASGFTGVPYPDDGYIDSGDAEGDEARAQIVALYRSWENDFFYTWDTTIRLTPDLTGGGDCSSTIMRAYQLVTGMDIGLNTTGMFENSDGKVIAEGSYGDTLPINIMKPADIVLIDWSHYQYGFGHVELYMGNNELWGHGGGNNGEEDGPNLTTSNADTFCATSTYRWQVKRFILP